MKFFYILTIGAILILFWHFNLREHEITTNDFSCEKNSDCVIVATNSCCGRIAINKKNAYKIKKNRKEVSCAEFCLPSEPECINQKCEIKNEQFLIQ